MRFLNLFKLLHFLLKRWSSIIVFMDALKFLFVKCLLQMINSVLLSVLKSLYPKFLFDFHLI